MSLGVALKQRSLILTSAAKQTTTTTTTGPLNSLRDLLSGAYPDSGVGASDSDDDELRLLQSRSPSVTTLRATAESEAGENNTDGVCQVSRSIPPQRHHQRRWRHPRSKQNDAANGPVIIVNGNAGVMGCRMQRKTIGRRKRKTLKRRTAKKGVGGQPDGKPGDGNGRTPPGAPMWTNLQYFAATPAKMTGSDGRLPTLSQAVQTDFAMVDAKSVERVFAGDPSGIAPELVANILRTLSSERFSWGALMRVLQGDLTPKDGFGVYSWGVRRGDSQALRLPLPPTLSLRPSPNTNSYRLDPPKPFLKIEGSQYTAAGLVKSKQSVGHQTNGCHFPAQWFLPKHESRTPGELAIIMGRERNRKKINKSARDSQVGSTTTQCTSGFSRTLEEGETKQRNMHVSTRSLRLPTIKGAYGDKKTLSTSLLKANRLPVSVSRQWPPHHRYTGSTRNPPDPGVDVRFEFSVVKLPRLDRHVSLLSSGVGSLTPVGRGYRPSGTRVPKAPPVTPVTSMYSPTLSLGAVCRSSLQSATTHSTSSGSMSRHVPLYTPTLLLAARRPERHRGVYNKAKPHAPRVAEDGDLLLRENGAKTERFYSKREYALTNKSVHSHEAVLKMPSVQHEVMSNKFRGGTILKKPRSKSKM